MSLPAGPQTLSLVPSSKALNSNSPKFLLCIYWTPSLQALVATHSARDSLLDWLLPRSPNHKLCRCSVTRNTPSVERLIVGRKLYRKGIPLKESPGNSLHLAGKPFSNCWVGCPAHGGIAEGRDIWSESNGREEDA